MTIVTPVTKRKAGSIGLASLEAVAGFAAVVGCGANDEQPFPATGSFEQWDSAGVHIAQGSGEALQTSLPWVFDTVPDLEIGTIAGEEPYQFSDITSVVAIPDGEIVVVDQGSLDIRWFDGRGTFLRAVGGAGQGPGEFVRAQVMPQFQPDSLFVLGVAADEMGVEYVRRYRLDRDGS